MLEIRNAAGLTLELPSDQRLTIEINSTIFDTSDVIKGSYSYPFKFGLSPNNCRFIGNSHLPESPPAADIQVMVKTGPFQFVALLTFRTQGLYADAALLIDLGEIADKIRSVPVREFVTEQLFISTNEVSGGATLLKLATAPPNRYPCVFPPFHNSEMVDEGFKPVDPEGKPVSYTRPTIVNVCYPGTPEPLYSNTELGSGDRLLVPMVYVCWLISYICQKLGFAASGSLFTDPVLSRLIIYNTQTTPGLSIDTGGYTVEIGRHLGTYSVSEFFKAIRAYIGISIDVNLTSRKAVFNTYNAMTRMADYVDLSSSVIPETDGVDKSPVNGFTVTAAKDDSDKYVRYHPFPFDSRNIQPKQLRDTFSFVVGQKQTPVSLGIGTLRMDSFKNSNNTTEAGPEWLIPATQHAGNLADPFFELSQNYSPYFDAADITTIPEAKNSWGLRMLIYWGLQKDTADQYYPYASSVSYDSKYRIIGPLSLQPGEPDDIWTRYQKTYYEFLAESKKVSLALRLSLPTLSRISTSTPIGFKLSNQVLGKYLLEKMKYELPDLEGYVLAEFEGRQLVPKTMKAGRSLEPALISAWVHLKIENYVTETNGNGSIQYWYGDIVAYTWKDGLFTEPENGQGFQIEYVKKVVDYDINQISSTKTTRHSVYISGHRQVIEPKSLAWIAGNPRGLIKWTTWAMLDGDGYRTR